jgi:hypothetical protein
MIIREYVETVMYEIVMHLPFEIYTQFVLEI